MSARPGLIRGSLLNFTEGAISLLCALVVSIWLARTLHPDGFGLYALVMSIVWFIYLFARMGFPGTVRRYAAELDGRGEVRLIGRLVGRALLTASLSAAAAALLLGVAADPLSRFFGHPELRGYLLLGALLLLPMIPISVLRGLLGGLQLYRSLMLVSLVTSPIWAAACVLVLLNGRGITGVLLATLAVEFLNLGAFVWQARRRVSIDWRSPLPEALRLRLRRYNLTLAGLILLEAIVWQRSELLFLGRFQPSEQLSFYALPFALTERLTELIPGALLGVLLPGLTFAQATGDSKRFRAVFGEALRYLTLLTVPLCILGILLAPVIVSVLYGEGFTPASTVLQILLVAVIFGVLAQASRSALLGMELQGWLLKSGVAAAAASIALDLLLIPRLGSIGAAMANASVQGGWALALFLPLAARLRKRSDSTGQDKASVDLSLGLRLKSELEHRV